MSPVHSLSAPSSRIQRRTASPTTARLFPECSDISSMKPVPIRLVNDTLNGDRKAVGDAGILDQTTTDCPPAPGARHGTQSRETGPVRNAAAFSPERARERLVGIARLAASSPPAETLRKSAEKPDDFVLPVKSRLDRF